MKKKLLSIVCYLIIVLTVSAQDTLKVNFKKEEISTAVGWDSILVADKTSFEDGASDFSAFNGTISVEPMWLNTPVAENVRAVDRNNDNYTGSMANVLQSYIAIDNRYDNDCNTLAIKISGLPEGTYTFESYHHDFGDQYGSFIASVKVGTDVYIDPNQYMISHSMTYETFQDTYDSKGEGIPDTETDAFIAHSVFASIDSVTKFTYNKIKSTGPSDNIVVQFTSVLPNSPDVDHHVKFVLINGFKLYESPAVDIENIALNSMSVYPNPASDVLYIDFNSNVTANSSFSILDLTGKEVLNNSMPLKSKQSIDVSGLSAGIYLLKVTNNEEQVVTKFEIK